MELFSLRFSRRKVGVALVIAVLVITSIGIHRHATIDYIELEERKSTKVKEINTLDIRRHTQEPNVYNGLLTPHVGRDVQTSTISMSQSHAPLESKKTSTFEAPPGDITEDPNVDRKIDEMNLKLPLLRDFRSPCWYEELDRSDIYQVKSHPYVQYIRPVKKILTAFTKNLENSVQLLKRRYSQGAKRRLRCLPSLYIIGGFRSGSTSLYGSLVRNHREVMKGGPSKEPQYWNSVRTGGDVRYLGLPRYVDRLDHIPPPRMFKAYVDIFDSSTQYAVGKTRTKNGTTYHPTIIVDGSPTYLTNYDRWDQLPGNRNLTEPKYILADLLKKLTPDIKLIAILRNPVDRLYSQYFSYDKEKPKSPELFHQLATKAVDLVQTCLKSRTLRSCVYDWNISNATPPFAVKHSLYFPFVRDWLRVFGDNFKVVRSEDYYKHPLETVTGLSKFLGLPLRDFKMGSKNSNLKQDYKRRYEMLDKTHKLLVSFYRPYNQQLADMLGDRSFLWDDNA